MSRPSFDSFGSNWRNSDLPLLQKIAVATKNTAIKIKNGSSCCGNHGEPGC